MNNCQITTYVYEVLFFLKLFNSPVALKLNTNKICPFPRKSWNDAHALEYPQDPRFRREKGGDEKVDSSVIMYGYAPRDNFSDQDIIYIHLKTFYMLKQQ